MHRYNVLMLRRLGKVSLGIAATAAGEGHRFGDSLSVSAPPPLLLCSSFFACLKRAIACVVRGS